MPSGLPQRVERGQGRVGTHDGEAILQRRCQRGRMAAACGRGAPVLLALEPEPVRAAKDRAALGRRGGDGGCLARSRAPDSRSVFPAVPGKDIFVEDHPEHFARQVLQLMTDAELRKTVSLHARKVIKENYNWDKNLEKLEKILLEVVKHKHYNELGIQRINL